MIDDLDRDLTGLVLLEGVGGGGVQHGPGGLVYFGPQGALESIVRGIQNGVFNDDLFHCIPIHT